MSLLSRFSSFPRTAPILLSRSIQSSLPRLSSPASALLHTATKPTVPLSALNRSPKSLFASTSPALSYSLLRPFSTSNNPAAVSSSDNSESNSNAYHWIDDEARELIARAYSRHKQLADKSRSYPPSLSVADLEKIGEPAHFKPQDFVDLAAERLMRFLRIFVHGFFREKYDHHAVCLETVAAVPGIVGGFHRHLRSLRRMERDHGWINVMMEEAENERMHLLIFMQVCKPTVLERGLVIVAQGMYLTFYSVLYLFHSRAAHRLTGYLEEEAHRAYTDYLASIDAGKIPNKPAPQIAKDYYRLPADATMRDVILHVRADEAMHRDVNHYFGSKYGKGDLNSPPKFLQEKK